MMMMKEPKDVVNKILKKDTNLFKRDLLARLEKKRFWKKHCKDIDLEEPIESDDNEQFDWWR